jgi:NAD(P)-dependent dehydrogenase (short-subunit alcohol dehydrogenase family)
MSKQRVVLVTGGMGGLGETISTKMADAGYKVAVTYSPGNTRHAEWVADMEGRGYRAWTRRRPSVSASRPERARRCQESRASYCQRRTLA